MYSENDRQFRVAQQQAYTATEFRQHGINNHKIALGESRFALGVALAEGGDRKIDRLVGRILVRVYRKYA